MTFHGSRQIFAQTNFVPVYMEQCKFCYWLQWCLHWVHASFETSRSIGMTFFTSLLWVLKLMLLANHLVVRNSTQQIKRGGRQKPYVDRWRNKLFLHCLARNGPTASHNVKKLDCDILKFSFHSYSNITPLIKLSYHWEVRPGIIHAFMVCDFFQCRLFCILCMLTEKYKYIALIDEHRRQWPFAVAFTGVAWLMRLK